MGNYPITCSGPATTASTTDGVTYNAKYLTNTPGSLTITPKPITVTAAASNKTYDATTSSIGVPTIAPALISPDSSGFTQSFDSANAGPRTLLPAGTVNDNNSGKNYAVTRMNNTGVINKANAIVTVTPYNVTYDGMPHTATVTSITGVASETNATVGTVMLNTTNTNAGTYSDSWSFKGAANYNDISSTQITDTINPATPGLPGTQTTTTIYGTTESLIVTVSGVTGGETPKGTVQFQFTTSKPVTYNVCSDGTLQVQPVATPCVVTLDSGGKATVTTTNLPAGVTADMITATYNPADANYTSGATAIDYTVNMAATQATLNITSSTTTPPTYGDSVTLSTTVKDNTTNSTGIPTGTVQFQFTNAGVTENVCADGTLQVQPAPPNPPLVSPCAVTLNVNGADTAAVAQTVTTSLPAGTSMITVIYSSDSNFSGTSSGTTEYTVSPKALTVTGMTAHDKPYDGATAATLATTVENLVGVISPDVVSLTGTAAGAFTPDAKVAAGKTVTISGLSLTGAAASNYTLTPPTATAGITAVQLTLTAPSLTVPYGDPTPSPLTPMITGFVNSEGTEALTTLPTCNTTYTPTSNAGTAQTTSCSGGVATNYSFNYVNGAVTVNQAPVTVMASSPTVNYGDQVPVITAGFGAFKNNQNSSVLTTQPTCTTAYTTMSNVGSSPTTSCYGGVATNYSFTYVNGAVTINQATSTTIVTGGTFTYDTLPHAAKVAVIGVGGLSLTPPPAYSGSCSAPPVTVAQGISCTAGYTYLGDSNHLGSSGSASVTITQATAAITLSDLTQPYANSLLSPTVTTVPQGVAFSWIGAPDTPAGTYSVTATVNDPNYMTSSASGSFVITPAVDFTALALNGNATTVSGPMLRLSSNTGQTSSAWLKNQRPANSSFSTSFSFQITHVGTDPSLGDGFAFVIQSDPAGSGSLVNTQMGGTLGYAGITNSIAIEFDTYQNMGFSDPPEPHIGIQSNRSAANSPDHLGSAKIGGPIVNNAFADGGVHTATVTYDATNHVLSVFLDTTPGPIVTAPVDLSTFLGVGSGGNAVFGFTAATGTAEENSDILTWNWN